MPNLPSIYIKTVKTSSNKTFYYVYRGNKCLYRAGEKYKDAVDLRDVARGDQVRQQAGLGNTTKTIALCIDEYINQSRLHGGKKNTIRINIAGLGHLKKVFGNMVLQEITSTHLLNLRTELLKTHNINGVNFITRVIAAFFSYTLKMKYIKEHPAKELQLQPQKVARFLNAEEIKKLLTATCTNLELKTLVRIALGTGMRVGEILKLRPENIIDNVIHVNETKTGEPRLVPIHPNLIPAFSDIDFLKQWSSNRLNRAWRRAVKRANIGHLRFHDLRHTWASMALHEGLSLSALQKMGGWKTLSAMEVYTHIDIRDLKEKNDRIKFDFLRGT